MLLDNMLQEKMPWKKFIKQNGTEENIIEQCHWTKCYKRKCDR